ncbi:helix-turn-helix transcriptional regulator [Actinoplanes sp. NPDC051851]|uniref:helix-turn-helix transcriptional regulator n=1 Tax=Actinoplanes sp. NPDC051851 TaxID=3154753 RepID=UPI003428D800
MAEQSFGRIELETRDLDQVTELIRGRYVDNRPRVLQGARDFVFRSQAAWADQLTVDHMTYGATMAISADPFRTVLIVTVLDGVFDVTAGREHCRAGPGGSVLYLPNIGLDVVMDRMTLQVVQFPTAIPTRLASRLGIDPADFRFERMTPVSETANHQWQTTVVFLTRLLAAAGPAEIPPLMLNATLETTAAAALSTFPNTTMTMDYIAGPGQSTPAVVRRAMDYIDAHAGEPILLEQVAAASGVGVRALQSAFSRHRDTTPMAYLRRVRLEGAHRDLQAADWSGGETVAGIAERWGFGSPSRFAADYRKLFGRTPSQTLQA